MKCAACGYEYIVKTEIVQEAVFFQSGKRKGEYKTSTQREVTLSVGHTPFRELVFKKDVDEIGYKGDTHWDRFIPVELFMCPECGTVKAVDWGI